MIMLILTFAVDGSVAVLVVLLHLKKGKSKEKNVKRKELLPLLMMNAVLVFLAALVFFLTHLLEEKATVPTAVTQTQNIPMQQYEPNNPYGQPQVMYNYQQPAPVYNPQPPPYGVPIYSQQQHNQSQIPPPPIGYSQENSEAQDNPKPGLLDRIKQLF